jgi:hypothetical protein
MENEDLLATELNWTLESSWVESYVTTTVSRPVCLGIKHPSGAYDQIFITVRQLRVCGALSLTRGRVYRYNCCWPSPAQSFSGPSPVGHATIFYCLRFETSIFVSLFSVEVQTKQGTSMTQAESGDVRQLHCVIFRKTDLVSVKIVSAIVPSWPFQLNLKMNINSCHVN